MPEADGDEMVCHLRNSNAEFGDTFKKVSPIFSSQRRSCSLNIISHCHLFQIDVNGDNAIPLYRYLKDKQNGIFGDRIKWNFTKFLVDKNGQAVDRFAPTTDPSKLGKEIEKLL